MQGKMKGYEQEEINNDDAEDALEDLLDLVCVDNYKVDALVSMLIEQGTISKEAFNQRIVTQCERRLERQGIDGNMIERIKDLAIVT